MQFSQIQHEGHSESGEATSEMSLILSVQVTFRKKIIRVIAWEKFVVLLLYKPFASVCLVLPSLTWKRSKPVTLKKIKKRFTMKESIVNEEFFRIR